MGNNKISISIAAAQKGMLERMEEFLNNLRLEEYKHLSQSIIELEKRIDFIITRGITFSLIALGLIVRYFKEDLLLFIDLSIIIVFVILVIFGYVYNLRQEILKIGMYRKVFFEDYYVIYGWENRLSKIRKKISVETLDYLPYILILLSCLILILNISAFGDKRESTQKLLDFIGSHKLETSGIILIFILLVIEIGFHVLKWRKIKDKLEFYYEEWSHIRCKENVLSYKSLQRTGETADR